MRDDGYFLIGAGSIIVIGMLGALLLIPRVNPVFILYQMISLFSILAIIYFIFNRHSSLRTISRPASGYNLLSVFLLLFITIIAAILLEGVPLGSVIITSIASATAGLLSYLIIKPYTVGSTENSEKTNLLYLFAILILGFVLRYYVMGWREIPIGNDAPTYLLQALKGSDIPLMELFKSGLSFSGDPYQDTWQFSQLWLAMSLKGLKLLGLGPIYISKVVIPFLSSLSIIGIYLLGRTICDQRLGITAALVFALLPTEVLFAQLYKEILGELSLILSLAFLLKTVIPEDQVQQSSKLDKIMLLISIAILAKSAITSMTFFILFCIALGSLYLLLSGRMALKNAVLAIILGSSIAIAISLYGLPSLGGFLTRMNELGYFRVYGGMVIHPYGYFALPIMTLTNIVPSTVVIFYIYKMIRGNSLEAFEVKALRFSLPVLLTICLVSLLLTTIMGYNLFPGSLFYYSIRMSIYAGIPLAMVAAAFIIRSSRYNKNALFVIISILLINFYIATAPGTTVHSSLLTAAIDEESYRLLESIDGFDPVFVLGNFSLGQYRMDGRGLGYKNWIEYVVYKNTGRDPIFIDSINEVSDQAGKVIKYENCSLTKVR